MKQTCQFLGWIDETEPLAELMDSLEATGLTPADPGFYCAARKHVDVMDVAEQAFAKPGIRSSSIRAALPG